MNEEIQECAGCNVPIVERPLFTMKVGNNTCLMCYCCILPLYPEEAARLVANGFTQINCAEA